MIYLLIVLLAVWLIVSIVGFAIKGLIWLAFIGLVLFIATAVIGFVRRSMSKRS